MRTITQTMRRQWSIVLCGLFFCGCSLTKPQLEVRHYTLEIALPEAGSATALATLVVRPFSAQDPYSQERLVYRTSPYQLDFYNYHRWAAAPSEQIADWTRRYLRGAALFARVYPTGEGAADFALSGKIRRLEEVDHDQTWEAVLGIDFWLTRAEQRTPVWFQSYTAVQQATKRNPAAVAEAISRNLETILGKLAADLAPAVAVSPGP